ncbi:MAG: hypothetical protein OXC28_17385 [Defluviicoccus sp.]|nr:hypothetical protein [Defluviicoccus sp.]
MSKHEIHLCGSIPLADAGEVFATVSDRLGGAVKRIPDGETGERLAWIRWQDRVFRDHPQLEPVESEGDYRNPTAFVGGGSIAHTTWWRIGDGVSPDALEMRPLGYAACAIESFATFEALQGAGKIARDTRFLIAVPSPFNVLNSAIAPADRIRVEPSYVARMLREIDEVAQALPHERIAWQWDNAHDMQAFDGARQSYFPFHRDGIAERLVACGEAIPAGIEMGYHLCYGSFGGRHFVEPRDMGAMVDLANRLASGVERSIDWIHMPVPVERDDEAYFEPLRDLALKPETTLFLGLIHDTDGVDGTRRRMATADRFVAGYGIATECGFGRRPAETVGPLLDIHAALAGV